MKNLNPPDAHRPTVSTAMLIGSLVTLGCLVTAVWVADWRWAVAGAATLIAAATVSGWQEGRTRR